MHTPTPWFHYTNDEPTAIARAPQFMGEGITRIADMNGAASNPEMMADAEFIVRACNSHDKLVTALRDALRLIDDDDDPTPDIVALVCNNARRALAKAEAA